MDRLAKVNDLFRCFCSHSSTNSTKLLSKLNWYNGMVTPNYYDDPEIFRQQRKQNQSQKNIMRYCNKVMENIVANNVNNKQVCYIDFLINDISKSSLQQALTIEKAYDNSRIPGLMYCTYKT